MWHVLLIRMTNQYLGLFGGATSLPVLGRFYRIWLHVPKEVILLVLGGDCW